MPPAAPHLWRWVHPDQRRYYQAVLSTDLFGDWTLTLAWGGLGSARVTFKQTPYALEV
jgi:hypothetical protein